MAEKQTRRANAIAISELLDWLNRVNAYTYPVAGREHDVLRKHACVKPASFARLKAVMIHAFTRHGRYGRRMHAAYETVGGPLGLDERRVRRDFACAEELGWIERDGVSQFGTVQYRIRPFLD